MKPVNYDTPVIITWPTALQQAWLLPDPALACALCSRHCEGGVARPSGPRAEEHRPHACPTESGFLSRPSHSLPRRGLAGPRSRTGALRAGTRSVSGAVAHGGGAHSLTTPFGVRRRRPRSASLCLSFPISLFTECLPRGSGGS